jgi:DNA-binding LacI/PurR family transcriptional regulator
MRQPVYRSYARSVARFARATNRPYDDIEGLYTGNVTMHYITSQFLKSHMESHFREALEDRSLTAWVGANDMVGLVALGYLRGSRIAVPSRISVVSFDDMIEAFGVGLSSYNFNVAAIVRCMFEHILSPPRPRDPVIADYEIPGMVMARRSSGPATVT